MLFVTFLAALSIFSRALAVQPEFAAAEKFKSDFAEWGRWLKRLGRRDAEWTTNKRAWQTAMDKLNGELSLSAAKVETELAELERESKQTSSSWLSWRRGAKQQKEEAEQRKRKLLDQHKAAKIKMTQLREEVRHLEKLLQRRPPTGADVMGPSNWECGQTDSQGKMGSYAEGLLEKCRLWGNSEALRAMVAYTKLLAETKGKLEEEQILMRNFAVRPLLRLNGRELPSLSAALAHIQNAYEQIQVAKRHELADLGGVEVPLELANAQLVRWAGDWTALYGQLDGVGGNGTRALYHLEGTLLWVGDSGEQKSVFDRNFLTVFGQIVRDPDVLLGLKAVDQLPAIKWHTISGNTLEAVHAEVEECGRELERKWTDVVEALEGEDRHTRNNASLQRAKELLQSLRESIGQLTCDALGEKFGEHHLLH